MKYCRCSDICATTNRWSKKACAFGILQRRTLYFISMIVIKIAGGHLRRISARVNNTERAAHDEFFVGFPAMPVVCM